MLEWFFGCKAWSFCSGSEVCRCAIYVQFIRGIGDTSTSNSWNSSIVLPFLMHLQMMKRGLQILTKMESRHTLNPRNVKHSFRGGQVMAGWWPQLPPCGTGIQRMKLQGRKMENGRRAREIWEFVMVSQGTCWLRLKICEANCCKDMQQHKFIYHITEHPCNFYLLSALQIEVTPLKRMQSPFAAVVFAALEVLKVPWCWHSSDIFWTAKLALTGSKKGQLLYNIPKCYLYNEPYIVYN